MLVGDSIVANMNTTTALTNLMRPVGKVIVQVAHSGDEVATQYTTWLASTARADPRVRWVYVQCGVNNILHGIFTAAQILADFATLIADIQAQNPNADIHLSKMDPCRAKLDAQTAMGGKDRYQLWLDVSSGLATAYPTLWHTTVSDALNDGADNLDATYDSGDTLHPNASGNALAATTLNTWAQGLPGGWS